MALVHGVKEDWCEGVEGGSDGAGVCLRETPSTEWETCLYQWTSLLRVWAAVPQEGKIFPHFIPHTECLSMTASNMPMNKILLIAAT